MAIFLELERRLKRLGALSDALLRLAAQDAAVHKLYIEVQNFLKPRSVYRNPELVERVKAVMAEGRVAPN